MILYMKIFIYKMKILIKRQNKPVEIFDTSDDKISKDVTLLDINKSKFKLKKFNLTKYTFIEDVNLLEL